MTLLKYSFIPLLLCSIFSHAQDVRYYLVPRTSAPPVIDGRLDESDWSRAPLTESFVEYADGTSAKLSTQGKFLWDDACLYIAFICEDPDVWGELENRDDHLWNGEVVEILGDPDGDGKQYFEVQVNPLGTLLDLLMDKAYFEGGKADFSWQLDSLKAGVWVDGTLNDKQDEDRGWTVEVALPFDQLAALSPTQNHPPQDGDEWRILITRYDYERTGDKRVEITAWNQTDSRGFHVPEKFGRIVFSGEGTNAGKDPKHSFQAPGTVTVEGGYPNPFNPTTNIRFEIGKQQHLTAKIYDIRGQEKITLVDQVMAAGTHEVYWDGRDRNGNSPGAGIYYFHLKSTAGHAGCKLVLLK